MAEIMNPYKSTTTRSSSMETRRPDSTKYRPPTSPPTRWNTGKATWPASPRQTARHPEVFQRYPQARHDRVPGLCGLDEGDPERQGPRKTVTITLMDDEMQEVASWQLEKAWPTKYSAPDFNATSNEVAIESLNWSARASPAPSKEEPPWNCRPYHQQGRQTPDPSHMLPLRPSVRPCPEFREGCVK